MELPLLIFVCVSLSLSASGIEAKASSIPTASDSSTVPCDIGDPHFVWDSKLKECLQVGNDTLLSKCKSDLQCLRSSLGKLSRCSPETGLCECYDWESKGRASTICFNGKCYAKKLLEDLCREDEECQAGVHVDAVCVQHPNFLPHETVCMCPEGRSCKNLGDTCADDKECEDGVSPDAMCSLHIGELVCVCPEGKVCVKELREASGNIRTWEIVGIVLGAVGGIGILGLVIVLVLRCRRTDYYV